MVNEVGYGSPALFIVLRRVLFALANISTLFLVEVTLQLCGFTTSD